jgi:DNA-directed RNA polymerase specialized sigma24 family protein
MDGGSDQPLNFDAWVAGRSAALTRFAYLLTGSDVAAEHALTSALAVACATWSRVRRSDDPEAHVRRLVVEAHLGRGGLRWRRQPVFAVPADPRRAAAHQAAESRTDEKPDDVALAWTLCAGFPPEQRAALVLRCHAEMTYPQIAGAMGGKASLAAQHVKRSFEALRAAVGERRTDDDVETAYRDAFAEHADDPTGTGDRAPLAHQAARRRRRRQVLPTVAGVTLLVAGLAGVAISHDGVSSTTATVEPGAHPRGWRAESYNGIQLWVPSSWGWGQVPRLDDRRLRSCGLSAYSPTSVKTSGIYLLKGAAALPYVGRPAKPATACAATTKATGAHVWFDSPLPPQTGPVQTTVRVNGITTFDVTVTDANRAERATILASIEQVAVDAYGCPRDSAGVNRVEAVSAPEPSPRRVHSLSLCLFAAGPAHQRVLFYSTRVDGADARAATAQIEAAPEHRSEAVCLVTRSLSQVLLIAHTASAPSVFGVYPGTCPRAPVGYVTGSSFHVLTGASRRLWAIDGLSLYASPGLLGDRLTPVLPSR